MNRQIDVVNPGQQPWIYAANLRDSGTIVGTYPSVALGTPEDLGRGRLLPTTATSQLAATLATWFGVPAGSLTDALPYIQNFGVRNLGLFA